MRCCRLFHTLTLRHFGALVPILTTKALMLYMMVAVHPSKVAAYNGYSHCTLGSHLKELDLSYYDGEGKASELWLSLRLLGTLATDLKGIRLGYEAGRLLMHEGTIDDHITVRVLISLHDFVLRAFDCAQKDDRLPDIASLWPKLRRLDQLFVSFLTLASQTLTDEERL